MDKHLTREERRLRRRWFAESAGFLACLGLALVLPGWIDVLLTATGH